MGAELLLIRHAEPQWPQACGPDEYHRALTDRGLAQAEQLADELTMVRPCAVVSSPYLRSVQTVEPTAHILGLPIRTEHDLREWESGIGAHPDYLAEYERSWADPDFARPGSESLTGFSGRAMGAVRSLADEFDDGVVVVGSHGTFISRVLLGLGHRIDLAFSSAMPMPSVYRLSVRDDGITATGPGL